MGTNLEAAEVHSSMLTKEDTMTRTQPFMGQIGPFLLLEEAIELSHIQTIFARVHAQVNSDSTEYVFGQHGGNFIFDNKTVKICFSYSPKVKVYNENSHVCRH